MDQSKNNKKNVLITGGNSGIGLSLVKKYLSSGYHVIATYRTKTSPLNLNKFKSKNLETLHVDFIEKNSEKIILSFLGKRKIDIVIHNACYFPKNGNKAFDLSTEDWLKAFKVNTIFPISLTAKMTKNLLKSPNPKVVFISSRRGSNYVNIKDSYIGRYEYRSTKSALNSSVIALNDELKNLGILTLLIHPGRVATKLTNFDGISPDESANNIFKLVEDLDSGLSGNFICSQSRNILPW